MSCQCSYVGSGIAWAALYGSERRFEVANTSSFTHNVESEDITVADYDSLAGGNCAKSERITAVTGELEVFSYCAPMMAALALSGDANAVPTAAIAAEAHKGYQGSLMLFQHAPDAATIAVTGPGGAPVYAVDTDYRVSAGGIVVLAGGGIADDADVEVNYTPLANRSTVEAFIHSSRNYQLVLEGLNRVGDGAPAIIRIHKAAFGPAASINWKSTTEQGFTVACEALKDDTITGTGLSPYMTVEIAN